MLPGWDALPVGVRAGLALLAVVAAGAAAAWTTARVVAYVQADPGLRRSMRASIRIRLTWRRLARQSRLTMQDFGIGQKGAHLRVKTPPLRRVRPGRYGVDLEFTPIPQVGQDEFVRRADDLANAWKAARVVIRQPAAGRIQVRALHTDPLTMTTTADPPPRIPADPKALHTVLLGLDDSADEVRLRLANSSGIGIYGTPGFGKSVCIRWLISRLAPSRAAQFVVLDGKTATGLEGDYAELAPRLSAVVGDDMETANTLLQEMVALRRQRAATIRAGLGSSNFWDAAPTVQWPMIMVIVDEAHTYMQTVPGGGSEELKKRNRLAGHNFLLLEDLAKKGRSVGIVLVLATQKGTSDALPTAIRDVLAASLSFAVRTLAAAVAALGPAIVDHEDANPTGLLKEEYRGVCTLAAEGVPGFTRVRVPFVPADLAAAVARATAHYVADLPGVHTGTGHRRRPATRPPSAPSAPHRRRPPATPPAVAKKPAEAAPAPPPPRRPPVATPPPRRRAKAPASQGDPQAGDTSS